MKYFTFLFFLFFLISIYSCRSENKTYNPQKAATDISSNTTEEDEESLLEQKKRKELRKLRIKNNKRFRDKVNEYLKELELEDKKIISREQFKKIFFKLFEFGKKEQKAEDEKAGKKEVDDSSKDKIYIDKIFNNLVPPKEEEFDVDYIINYFEPMNIVFSMKDTLGILGLDKKVDSLSESLLNALNAFDEKNKKKKEADNGSENTDL